MNEICIPTLLFWENENTWYGSKGQARFFIQPAKAEPSTEDQSGQDKRTLNVELWRGPLSKALSQIIATATFPLSQEGLEQTTAWLEEQATALNS